MQSKVISRGAIRARYVSGYLLYAMGMELSGRKIATYRPPEKPELIVMKK